jgi:hypothetical protein
MTTCHMPPQISEAVGDFPIVHPDRAGQPTRYTYIALTDVNDPQGQIKACGARILRYCARILRECAVLCCAVMDVGTAHYGTLPPPPLLWADSEAQPLTQQLLRKDT